MVTPEKPVEHAWSEWKFSDGKVLVCCDKCGIVKRTLGVNKPCKGVVNVRLR